MEKTLRLQKLREKILRLKLRLFQQQREYKHQLLREHIARKYVMNNKDRRRSLKVHYYHYRLRYSRPLAIADFNAIAFDILYPRDNFLTQPRK